MLTARAISTQLEEFRKRPGAPPLPALEIFKPRVAAWAETVDERSVGAAEGLLHPSKRIADAGKFKTAVERLQVRRPEAAATAASLRALEDATSPSCPLVITDRGDRPGQRPLERAGNCCALEQPGPSSPVPSHRPPSLRPRRSPRPALPSRARRRLRSSAPAARARWPSRSSRPSLRTSRRRSPTLSASGGAGEAARSPTPCAATTFTFPRPCRRRQAARRGRHRAAWPRKPRRLCSAPHDRV